MAKIDPLVQDFLAQKRIAVVGVSDKRETGCNLAYRKFKEAGYTVSAVNPRLTSFEGDPCYPDLGSIPDKPDAVFILTNPNITEQVVQQCVDLGVERVWMHCLMGTKPGLAASMTSVSQDAVQHVPGTWDQGDPGQLSEPVPEARFWPCHDAGDVPHLRFSECEVGLPGLAVPMFGCPGWRSFSSWAQIGRGINEGMIVPNCME